MLGTVQANDFEPLAAISEWLLGDPYITWDKQMKEASQVNFVQKYHL